MSGLKKFWSDSGLDKEEKFLKVSTALYKTELSIIIGILGYLISNLGVGPGSDIFLRKNSKSYEIFCDNCS